MTFTKEQLQQIEATAKEVLWPIVWTPLRARKHFEEKITPEVVLALARMALAGMEAEPVAWRIHTPSVDVTYVEMNSDAVEKVRLYCAKENIAVEITPLYTAQQPLTTTERAELENYRNAKQVVPGELSNKSFEYIANKFQVRISDAQWIVVGWNACRAAMQGKAETAIQPSTLRDGVEALRTSGIAIDSGKIHAERAALNEPVCWCRTCWPVSDSNVLFSVCPECGNKRCPHANDHRNACTGSNEPGQEGSAYPAAPQQVAE